MVNSRRPQSRPPSEALGQVHYESVFVGERDLVWGSLAGLGPIDAISKVTEPGAASRQHNVECRQGPPRQLSLASSSRPP